MARSEAAAHYIRAAEYFLGFDKAESAERLFLAAGQIYELERRRSSPAFQDAIDLAKRALDLVSVDRDIEQWAKTKYHLALLQQTEARKRVPPSSALLEEAMVNCQDVLNRAGTKLESYDMASVSMLLGICYHVRSTLKHNPRRKNDLRKAMASFEHVIYSAEYETLTFHRSGTYSNLSTVYRDLAALSSGATRADYASKAKQALLRSIELSAEEGLPDAWANAHHNLGSRLAEEAERVDPAQGMFLRVQAIAAFNASLEAYPQTAIHTRLAMTQLALGKVLFQQARHSPNNIKEYHLFRSLAANEAVIQNVVKESHPEMWSMAKHTMGLAFFLHSEIAEEEIAISDLEQALAYFEEALPGFKETRMDDYLKKLAAAHKEASTRLKNLRAAQSI